MTEIKRVTRDELVRLPQDWGADLQLTTRQETAYRESLEDFLPDAQLGSQSLIGSLLIGVAVDFAAKTIVPALAKKVTGELKSLWPEKTDAYRRSAVYSQTIDQPFWRLDFQRAEDSDREFHTVLPVCHGLIVAVRSAEVDAEQGVKADTQRLDAVYVIAFAYSELDPRMMQVRPLLWGVRKNAKQLAVRSTTRATKGMPARHKLGLAVELNVELNAFSYTESSAVRSVPLFQISQVDAIEQEIEVGAYEALDARAPGELRVKVFAQPETRGAFHGTPAFEVGAYPTFRVADAAAGQNAEGAAKKAEAQAESGAAIAGLRLFSEPYAVTLQVSERTPEFLKSSKARDWYIGFLDGLEGKLTEEGKKFVEAEGKKLGDGGDNKS